MSKFETGKLISPSEFGESSITWHQRAALIRSGELVEQIKEKGLTTDVVVFVYESVLPEGELLSFSQIIDKVMPGNINSYRVKQHAVQEILKQEIPNQLRKDLNFVRRGAFTRRTLAEMDKDVLKAIRAKNVNKINERTGTSWSPEDTELITIMAQSPLATLQSILDAVNRGKPEDKKRKKDGIRRFLKNRGITLANQKK